ncbi:hypothetical protein Ssi03_36650 [Sphaerisporangium siamense]|uniref:Chemotaxis protein histidine kinase CheA n=1 Tax=Sphaerisporangium siamense TaxID=795645 RepID=A0A7W7D764_9ACTN|nr:hypothetical protein [Sphaerisporangium siamense]MBB4701549.1 chemotaxis protein histidine kinase CheA [Sphaerisporangium siamense]GII85675.1 hypothetical protein Ssi03_36650 [Sphaerisporangium siamense]
MDLSAAADELYGGTPEDFVETRKRLAAEAKRSGDAGLARRIGGLRRPTVSAWAVNRLARSAPDELGRLLDLGDELRSAWAAGGQIGDLDRRRGELVARLLRAARRSADEAGRPLREPAVREVEDTLHAATMDPAVAEEVRAGHLPQPRTYAGFAPAGPLPEPAPEKRGESEKEQQLKPPRTPEKPQQNQKPKPKKPPKPDREAGKERRKPDRDAKKRQKADREAEKARQRSEREAEKARRKRERAEKERRERERAEEERRRRRAELVEAAEREARDAERTAAEWESETRDARRAHETVTAEVDRLHEELTAARTRQEAAARRLATAEHEHATATRHASAAHHHADSLREDG